MANYQTDAEIVKMFRAGKTFTHIRTHCHVGRERAERVIMNAGYTREDIENHKVKPAISDQMMVEIIKTKNEKNISFMQAARLHGFTSGMFYYARSILIKHKRWDEFEQKANGGKSSKQQPEEEKAPKDPRSEDCKQIKVCWQSRCYLHTQCPAFAAWETRKGLR